jgi:signal transduction histidine kinase
MTGWLAVLAVGFLAVLRHHLELQAEQVARTRAVAAAATVRIAPDGKPRALESAGDAALDYGIWVYSGRTAVQRPTGPRTLQRAADTLAGRNSQSIESGEALLYSVTLPQHGREQASVVASASLAAYSQAEQTTLVGTLVVSILILVGAYGAFRLAGRRALLPVEQMTHQAREWSEHAPDHRFGGGQHFAELKDLAHTLDGVLDRLSAVLRHERQLSAELSHELRTPLATIVAETDLLLSTDAQSPAFRAIRESALGMNDIIETLLTTARAELQSERAACDVRQVVEALVAGRAVPHHVYGPTGVIAGVDDTVATRLLAPLLDNAARFARSEVTIDISRGDEHVQIDIGNDGPPLSDTEREQVFNAGNGDGNGAGLGLTLARRLARTADGDVIAVPTTLGAVFRVTLPPG